MPPSARTPDLCASPDAAARRSRHTCLSSLIRAAVFICFAAFLSFPAQAQSGYTAEAPVRLYAFGALSYVRPDYGGANRNIGGTAGVDLNIGHFGKLSPGVEFRALGSGGRVSRQYNYAIGPRVEYGLGRLHPFAEFLVGYGSIKFEWPILTPLGYYVQDDALTYNYGGGLDYSLTRHWEIRADYLQQKWRLGENNGRINPGAMSAGVRYHFTF